MEIPDGRLWIDFVVREPLGGFSRKGEEARNWDSTGSIEYYEVYSVVGSPGLNPIEKKNYIWLKLMIVVFIKTLFV